MLPFGFFPNSPDKAPWKMRFICRFHGAFLQGILIMAIFWSHTSAFGQLTPGPLHRVHENLEGLRNCTQCHAIGSKDFQAKCLECHDLLKQRIDAGVGLHAQPEYASCQLCHSDHHGKEFNLIHWSGGMESFNHEATGYPLAGAHQKATCRDCHQAENMTQPEPLRTAGKDLNRTFLGLTQDCLSCHQDPHEGQLDRDCLSCHAMDSWQPAPKFEHDNASFKLLGAHAKVDCDDCHQPAVTLSSQVLRSFKPVEHDSCTSCHEDLHQGTLSQDCLSCHTMTAWNPVPRFNHANTAFALTGKHQQVSCDSCHKTVQNLAPGQPRIFEGIAFKSCANCHEDPHENRLGQDCVSCHKTSGWQQVADIAFDHSRTRFALEGKHSSVTCESCHRPDRPLAIAEFDDCTDCHKDEHKGQFQASQPAGSCEACHSVAGFLPSNFTLARHQETQFPLEGAHLALPCLVCHKPVGKPFFSEPTVHFSMGSKQCADCHSNPHGPELLQKLGQDSCQSCHTLERWTSIQFDHNQTQFPLLGGHQTQACISCHHHDNKDQFHLSALNQDCASCHTDIHQGQFASETGQTRCEQCHPNASWEPLLFDHNRDTTFTLEGAHLQASCQSCHPKITRGEIVFSRFKPTGTRCEDCHTPHKEGGPK